LFDCELLDSAGKIHPRPASGNRKGSSPRPVSLFPFANVVRRTIEHKRSITNGFLQSVYNPADRFPRKKGAVTELHFMSHIIYSKSKIVSIIFVSFQFFLDKVYIRALRDLAKFTNLHFANRTKICGFFGVNEFNFTNNPRFSRTDFRRFADYAPGPEKPTRLSIRREQIFYSAAACISMLRQKSVKNPLRNCKA